MVQEGSLWKHEQDEKSYVYCTLGTAEESQNPKPGLLDCYKRICAQTRKCRKIYQITALINNL